MKKLNNNSYKNVLKTVKPAYDKDAIWNGINDQLDQKKKRFVGVYFFTCFVVLGAIGLTLLFMPFSKNNETVFNADHTSANQINHREKESIETKINEALDIGEKIFTSEAVESQASHDLTLSSSGSISSIKEQEEQIYKKPTISNNDHFSEQKPFQSSGLSSSVKEQESFFNRAETKFEDAANGLDVFNLIGAQRINSKTPRALKYFRNTIDIAPIKPLQNKNLFSRSAHWTTKLNGGSMTNLFEGLTPEGEIEAQKKQNYITDLYQTGISVQYNWPINKNISFKGGVHFQRFTERFNYLNTIVTQETVASDSAQYITYVDGSTVYFSGELIETTEKQINVQHYNHHYSIGFNAGAQFQFPISKRVAVYSQFSFLFNPINFAVGRINGPSSEIVDLSQETRDLRSFWQMEWGTGLLYQVSHNYQLSLGFNAVRDLHNRKSSVNLLEIKKGKGLELGVHFGF